MTQPTFGFGAQINNAASAVFSASRMGSGRLVVTSRKGEEFEKKD